MDPGTVAAGVASTMVAAPEAPPPPTIDGAHRTWVARVRTQVVARQTAAKWAIGTVGTVTTKRVAGWHWLIVRCRQ